MRQSPSDIQNRERTHEERADSERPRRETDIQSRLITCPHKMSPKQDTPDRVPIILAIEDVLPCKVGVRLVCVVRARVIGDSPGRVVVAVGDLRQRVFPFPAADAWS